MVTLTLANSCFMSDETSSARGPWTTRWDYETVRFNIRTRGALEQWIRQVDSKICWNQMALPFSNATEGAWEERLMLQHTIVTPVGFCGRHVVQASWPPRTGPADYITRYHLAGVASCYTIKLPGISKFDCHLDVCSLDGEVWM